MDQKIEILRHRRDQADEFAKVHGLDMWGARVAWFVISEGVTTARALCARYNKQSPAYRAYQNLVTSGLVVEGVGGGILYTPHPEWEQGDGPCAWFKALATVAAGGERHPLL